MKKHPPGRPFFVLLLTGVGEMLFQWPVTIQLHRGGAVACRLPMAELLPDYTAAAFSMAILPR